MTNGSASTLVRGGLLVSGDGIEKADVLVSGAKVEEVGPALEAPAGADVIDAGGKYVLPGGVDAHAHPVFGDKMDTYTMRAAFGGVTTVIAFIGSERNRHIKYSNKWGDQDRTQDVVASFIDYASGVSYTDFAVHGLLTYLDVEDIDNVVPDLIGMGALSFKVFMTCNPWEPDHEVNLRSLPDHSIMRVMELAAAHGGLTMTHSEFGAGKWYLQYRHMSEGKTTRHYLQPAAPNIIEADAVYRASTMASLTGSPLYPVHLSAHESLPIIREFRDRGLRIFGETCPHYLTLIDDDLIERGYLLKVSPPLRYDEDRDAMWDGLADRTLNVIGSDCCGYTRSLKLTHDLGRHIEDPPLDEEDIFGCAAGLSTLEFMMPVVWSAGVNTGRITLPRLVQVMCENPAKVFGIYPRKGCLRAGSDADLVLWDPAKRHVVTGERGVTDFSTFEGFELLGMPVLTMVRGDVVVQDGGLTGKQGHSEYVPGDPAAASYSPSGHQVR